MSTKTLSVDEEAYRILSQARAHPRESFSQVIKRASWRDGKRNCARLLDRVRPGVPDPVLEALEQAQREDAAPEDKWRA
jgi:predicted CopG family antitoxin